MPYSAATLSSLNGFHKDRRAEKLEKLIPQDFHLHRDMPYKKGKKLGRTYLQPVFLTYPHGITFSASDVVPTLNAAVAAETKEASVQAYQIIGRERISYDAADRAASDEEAYENETEFLMEALRLSHVSKSEALGFYGGHANGLGTVASISGNILTITTSEWAGGIWAGAENMRLDVYTASTYVKTTSVSSADLDGLTVTVANATGITAGDALHYEGSYGNVATGLHQIITNSSTLFGIDAGTRNLWKGVTQTAGSTTAKLLPFMQAAAKARIKGMRGEVTGFVNAFSFVDMVDEIEAAKTNQELKGMSYERGAEGMKIFSPNGTITLKISDFVKRGFAFGVLMDGSWCRIGSSDITFNHPGAKKGEKVTFIHLQEAGGYEFRNWSNFAWFTSKPGANFVMNNIVNSAS